MNKVYIYYNIAKNIELTINVESELEAKNIVSMQSDAKEYKLIDTIESGRVSVRYFALPPVSDKVLNAIKGVIDYCEYNSIYDKLRKYGDFYYKLKEFYKQFKI